MVRKCILECQFGPLGTDFVTSFAKIDKHFRLLLETADILNQTFGFTIAIFIIDDVLYYSTNFQEVFILHKHSDWTTTLRNILYLCNSFAVLIFSANIVAEAKVIHEFLDLAILAMTIETEPRTGWMTGTRHMSSTQYLVYVNYVGRNLVAMKAANVFPITYSLVATVFVNIFIGCFLFILKVKFC